MITNPISFSAAGHTQAERWQPLVSQLIADALGEPVSIDRDAHVLNLSPIPAPHFTVPDVTSRRFIFTTDPKRLRQERQVTRTAVAVPLSHIRLTAPAEALAVWDELSRTAGYASRVFIPRDAEWYVLIEEPRRASSLRGLIAELLRAPIAWARSSIR
jgi:hypothetical protein